MKIIFLYLAIGFITLTSASSHACYVNGGLDQIMRSVTSNPSNLQLSFTDKIDDWSKVMGSYIFFEGEGKQYGGYVRFDQNSCAVLFSDIKELQVAK